MTINVNSSSGGNNEAVEQKNNYYELNLNEVIAVELTEHGKKYIHDCEIENIQKYGLGYVGEDMRKKYTHEGVFDTEKYVEEEVMPKYNGLCRIQLHELIKKFGNGIGDYFNSKPIFVDNNIYFKEEDVVVEQDGKKFEFHEGVKKVTKETVPGLEDALKGVFG